MIAGRCVRYSTISIHKRPAFANFPSNIKANINGICDG